jgi:hypothetical protein
MSWPAWAQTFVKAIVGNAAGPNAADNPIYTSGTITNQLVAFVRMQAYTSVISGELAGSASAVQMPDRASALVKFKASYNNAGRVYLGASASVTKADGATDITTGLQLSAGEETGWIPIENLNRFWRICDNAGDALTYWALN